jgi:hypothetical protein
MAKRLEDLSDRELDIRIVFSNLESIGNSAERMTSGNFMHNRASIKLTVKNIVNALHRLGIHEV